GLLALADGGHDLVPGLGQVAGHAIPPHRMVVDHHHPHGVHALTRISISVPAPGLVVMVAVPPSARSRPRMDFATPRRPSAAACRRRPAGIGGPSSRTVTVIAPPSSPSSSHAGVPTGQ